MAQHAMAQNQMWKLSDSLELVPKRFRSATVNDSLSKARFLARISQILGRQGFLAAQINIKDSNQNEILWKYDLGFQYQVQFTTSSATDQAWKPKMRKPIDVMQYANSIDKKLNELSNEGYPFASIERRILRDSAANFLIFEQTDLGPQIKIDSIRFVGTNKLKPWFLYRHLGIPKGSNFNLKAIENIPTKINTLPFLKIADPTQIFFYGENAVLYLYLKDMPINNFDGMIGFFPNTGIDGRLQLTGDVSLQLFNTFKVGEQLGINWRNLGNGTQDLRLKSQLPYWFGSAYGHDFDFRLFKRDSTFIEVNFRLATQITYKPNSAVQMYYHLKDFFQLGAQNSAASALTANVSTNLYGLSWMLNRLDRFQNPTKGYFFKIQTAAGNRKQMPVSNNSEPSINDTISKSDVAYHLVFSFETFLPLGKRFVIAANSHSDWQFNTSYVSSELFRFGGFKSLKGFDEESLQAARVTWFNVETRLLLDAGSYLYLFYNQAYAWNPFRMNNVTDKPFGFGAGLTFTNRTGVFSLAYALGSEQNNPISVRAAKVHFGYRYLLQ